jgi:hypothetical protein
MGDWGVNTEDATEAGVRQLLDQDTLAVMFDEIEAEEDNREVVMKIVRLARLAYSGASSLRGSSDHQAKQFVARSCFLFSSIHHHELPAQDRNRIAILQLSQLPGQTEKFAIPPQAREWGDQLRRRLIEQWPRFDARSPTYQREMLDQGYSGREQDTYGTCSRAATCCCTTRPPGDRAFAKVRQLAAIVSTARAEAVDISDRCVRHLASHRLPATGGAAPGDGRPMARQAADRASTSADDVAMRSSKRLGTHGLRVVHLRDDHEGTQGGLIDAYLHFRRCGWRAKGVQDGRPVSDVAGGRQQDQQGHAGNLRRARAGRAACGRRASAWSTARSSEQEGAVRRRLGRGLRAGAARRARRYRRAIEEADRARPSSAIRAITSLRQRRRSAGGESCSRRCGCAGAGR